VKEIFDAEEFVSRLPHGAVKRAFGIEAIFWFAEPVGAEHGEPLDRKREAGEAIGKGAVALEVAAGGEVACKGRGALPHLAAALSVTVVLLGELLAVDDPEALCEEEEKKERSEALGPTDLNAGKLHAFGGWL
jgi:hypothetical protein